MTKLLYADLTYRLFGLCFRVHNGLKGGHKEEVYEEALLELLGQEKMDYVLQPRYFVFYKGLQVGEYYPDLMFADGKVVADLKATAQIAPLHKAQVLSYVGVTKAELGLILNFGGTSFQSERLPNYLQNRKPLEPNFALPEGLLYPELTGHILSILHTVHHELGPGFLHQVYRRATRKELELQRINFIYLKELPLRFEGVPLTSSPTRLYLIEQKLLLATIAVPTITAQHSERMRWAMQETQTELGLIANFYPSRLDLRFLRV